MSSLVADNATYLLEIALCEVDAFVIESQVIHLHYKKGKKKKLSVFTIQLYYPTCVALILFSKILITYSNELLLARWPAC